MFWIVLCCMLARGASSPTMQFPQNVIEVAGLNVIRLAAKTDGIVPALQALKADFEAAVAAVSPCQPSPEFNDCAKCVNDACLARAAHVCPSSKYSQIKHNAAEYINGGQLATDVGVVFPDYSTSEADQALANYLSSLNIVGRRRRASVNPEPQCSEFENPSVCAFYVAQCSCSFVCPPVDTAVAAQTAFENGVTNFVSFELLELLIDFNSFDINEGGFTSSMARVEFNGSAFNFNMTTPIVPYQPEATGVAVANEAIVVFNGGT